MQLDVFNGSIAVPIDGRIGFGIPPTGDNEPTGPQLLAVAGDPSGVVTAPIGTLALDFATPALWQNTDGATAWTMAGGGGTNIAATRVLWIDQNVVPAPTAPDGSINNPYATIQAALDAAGEPTTVLDQFLPYTLNIVTGIYDENLVVPANRSLIFVAWGVVVVGTFGGAARNVTIDYSSVPPFPGFDNQITFDGQEQQNLTITGQILLTSTTTEKLEIEFNEFKVNGDGGGPPTAGIDATGWTGGGQIELRADRSAFDGDAGGAAILGGAGAPVLLSAFTNVEILGPVVVDSWSNFTRCLLEDDFTALVAPNQNGKATPVGFFDCIFGGGGIVYTSAPAGGVGGEILMDDATLYQWTLSGASFAGAEILTLISETQAGQTTYAAAGGPADPAWGGVAPTDVRGALDRIAAFLGPIP